MGLAWRLLDSGGKAFHGTNGTGAPTVAGTVVGVHPDDGFQLFPSSDTHPAGILVDSGDAPGARSWVAISGPLPVLLEDGTGANRGDWLATSSVPGRAVAMPKPVALGIPELYEHMRQVGYAVETVSPGTDVLCITLLKLI